MKHKIKVYAKELRNHSSLSLIKGFMEIVEDIPFFVTIKLPRKKRPLFFAVIDDTQKITIIEVYRVKRRIIKNKN